MADLGTTMDVLGERWALLVVREVSLGRRRFEHIQTATGAPRAVLSDRLKRLVDAGVLTTRRYRTPGARAREEYVLTEAGIDLVPLLAAFADWHARYRAGGRRRAAAPDVDYRHVACGGHVTAQLVCECGQRVSPHEQLVAQINT